MKKIVNILLAVFCMSCTSNTNSQVPSKPEEIKPLVVGNSLPNASLQNDKGVEVKLNSILEKKPTVLVFYRGGWCPYCNVQLSGLAKIEDEVLDLGYQIVAISPEDYQNLKSSEEETKQKYEILSDPDGEFIKDIGIAFQTPLMIKGYLAVKGRKGDTSKVIPVPTVMIVNEKSEILYMYSNPDYKVRISSEELLTVLKSMPINQ